MTKSPSSILGLSLFHLFQCGFFYFATHFKKKDLLPTAGSEKRGVLGVGSNPIAVLPSYQDMTTFALLLHKH